MKKAFIIEETVVFAIFAEDEAQALTMCKSLELRKQGQIAKQVIITEDVKEDRNES